jgi:hypothetical protein
MRYSIVSRVLICGALLILQACSHARVTNEQSTQAEQPSEAPVQDTEKAVLAGEWEYEEGGVVVPLRLDQYGNGTYDFKDGRFRTEVLSDHHWVGGWAQRANNREGGFEISLSPDFSEGEGRWWYTRIEGDPAPQKPGGRFHVMKVQSTVDNQSLFVDQSRSTLGR